MEALVHWFSQNLSQYISPEGAVFIISMIPLLELREDCLQHPYLRYRLQRQFHCVLLEILFLFRLFCCLSDRFSRF
mgnify:CR=1 FL=1